MKKIVKIFLDALRMGREHFKHFYRQTFPLWSAILYFKELGQKKKKHNLVFFNLSKSFSVSNFRVGSSGDVVKFRFCFKKLWVRSHSLHFTF